MIISGIVTNGTTKEPVPFALVYVSDSNGKPKGNISTQTDANGRYTLNGVNPSGYVTASYTGYNKQPVAVKNVVSVPNIVTGIPTNLLAIKLTPSLKSGLPEVTVTPQNTGTKISTIGSVAVDKKVEDKKSVDEVKEPTKAWVKIALGLGALAVLGLIIVAIKKDKKNSK